MPQKCSHCLYTELHPFGMTFVNGKCLGCITHEEKNQLDWADRSAKLAGIFKHHAKRNRGYDCVVPVTGDAEDYFTLKVVLEAALAPLVVCVNDYFKNDIGWHNLHNLITHFDVDSFVFNPDSVVYKELVRTSLRKHDHVLLPFLQLHTSFPVHIAHQRQIPLVVWGQNQATEQVGKFSHQDEVEMSRWSRKEHDLFNVDIEILTGSGAQVQERQLNYYRYPSPKSLHHKAVKGIYLSNYIPWDPLVQNQGATSQGYIPQVQASTFDPYERAGNSVYYGIHDILKQKRVGYRKIRDHLTREIRHGRTSLSQATALQQQYADTPVDIRPFFDWLGVTSSGYQWFLEHRLEDVRHLVDVGVENTPHTIATPKEIHSLLENGASPENEFIAFGKGIDI